MFVAWVLFWITGFPGYLRLSLVLFDVFCFVGVDALIVLWPLQLVCSG